MLSCVSCRTTPRPLRREFGSPDQLRRLFACVAESDAERAPRRRSGDARGLAAQPSGPSSSVGPRLPVPRLRALRALRALGRWVAGGTACSFRDLDSGAAGCHVVQPGPFLVPGVGWPAPPRPGRRRGRRPPAARLPIAHGPSGRGLRPLAPASADPPARAHPRDWRRRRRPGLRAPCSTTSREVGSAGSSPLSRSGFAGPGPVGLPRPRVVPSTGRGASARRPPSSPPPPQRRPPRCSNQREDSAASCIADPRRSPRAGRTRRLPRRAWATPDAGRSRWRRRPTPPPSAPERARRWRGPAPARIPEAAFGRTASTTAGARPPSPRRHPDRRRPGRRRGRALVPASPCPTTVRWCRRPSGRRGPTSPSSTW